MKTILVVDDEKDILNFFHRFLSKLGHEAVLTDSWETALEKFNEESFDLVILDVHMPGRDGFQIAKEMRLSKPDQKILVITGLGAGDVYKYFSSSEIDVTEILYKPFKIKKASAIISRILES